MFLVRDKPASRAVRLRKALEFDPAISVIFACSHFEWTAKRAIISLGVSPNTEIRKRLRKVHGSEHYKDSWKAEVFLHTGESLPTVVSDWNGVVKALKLRHKLVHGASSCKEPYAKKCTEWFLTAAEDIRLYCKDQGVDLYERLPVRRRARKAET